MTDATWLDNQLRVHATIWSKTMRLLLTTIILTMLAQPVLAVTIEGLNRVCKTYANNSFEYGDDLADIVDATMCTAYVAAVIDSAHSVCVSYKDTADILKEATDETAKGVLTGSLMMAKFNGSGATLDNLNAAIQAFLNYAANNPKDWQYHPSPYPWLSETFPCKK